MFNVGRPVAGLALVSAAATDIAQRAMTGGWGACKQHRAAAAAAAGGGGGCGGGGMMQLLYVSSLHSFISRSGCIPPSPPALADPLGQSNICFTASMCHLLGAQRLFGQCFPTDSALLCFWHPTAVNGAYSVICCGPTSRQQQQQQQQHWERAESKAAEPCCAAALGWVDERPGPHKRS